MDYDRSGLLATGSGDKTVRFWDTNTSTLLKTGEGSKLFYISRSYPLGAVCEMVPRFGHVG